MHPYYYIKMLQKEPTVMIGSVGGWVWTQTQDSVDQNGGKRKIDSYRKQGIQNSENSG